jgi:hypothetical protein
MSTYYDASDATREVMDLPLNLTQEERRERVFAILGKLEDRAGDRGEDRGYERGRMVYDDSYDPDYW